MKLFNGFEAVKFPEENLIFITHDKYLYYIYHSKYNYWRKYRNAGNDSITVSNYDDVSKEELTEAMQGVFPKSETDFIRLCDPEQLWIRDMLTLLREDYSTYMADYSIYHAVHHFLLKSNITHKSFLKLKSLFDNAVAQGQNNKLVLELIKELCFSVIGRDIFKQEIGIVDGHDSSSYFWIMPVRIVDYSNTNDFDNVAEMRSIEISIEEYDVDRYLAPFLYKHYDDNLEANKKRVESYWEDDDGNEHVNIVNGFEWYLTHNFFTLDSMYEVLKDIGDTIDALSSGRKNEFTKKIKDTEVELVIDFYRRFTYRMEYMMKVGKEKGYDLISFMGP